jgi:protein TonB
MRHRPPVATLLASLAVHGGALASLVFLVSSESPPSVLFIDLETIAEHATGVGAPEPKLAPAGGSTRRAPAGSARPAGRDAGRSGLAEPSIPPLALPLAPPAPPEPQRARDREPVPTAPDARRPEPAVAVVPARDTASDAAPRSEATAAPPEPRENPSGVARERAAAPAAAAGSDTAPGGGRGGAPGAGRSGGTAGAGGGTAVASAGSAGGAPGAEYGGYLAEVRRRLMEALRYPPPARNRGLSGTVLLDISIESNGAITKVSITRSSSHRLLDEAALEAARSLAPQPFPKGLAPKPLRVRLPVVFNLQ